MLGKIHVERREESECSMDSQSFTLKDAMVPYEHL